jgi:hypothetical protein
VRSLASVKHWHPELPYHVAEMPDGSNLLCKSKMFDLSPFDETLFLDADTTVMGQTRLRVRQGEQHGIACCINANPWQRRYYKIEQHPDEVEYSAGVVFFDKTWQPRVGVNRRRVPHCGTHGRRRHDVQLLPRRRRHQAPALQRSGPVHAGDAASGFNPFVLPLNWNLYPQVAEALLGRNQRSCTATTTSRVGHAVERRPVPARRGDPLCPVAGRRDDYLPSDHHHPTRSTGPTPAATPCPKRRWTRGTSS